MSADLDESATYRDPRAEDLARDRPCRNARGSFAGRGASAPAIVTHAILLPIGVVGVSRAEAIGDVAIIPSSLVGVLYQQLDGRARRHPVKHAAQDTDQVLFPA